MAGYHSENQYEPSVFKNVENRQKKTTIRNTLILGDSMLRHLRGNNMAKKLRKQKVYVKSYGGAKVGDMNHHAIPNLEYNPNHVIVHVGTNEIRTKKTAEKIAIDIIKLCENLTNKDNTISVSGLVYRFENVNNEKIDKVNKKLKLLCTERNLHFISHSNIPPTSKYLADGLHLTEQGNIIFTNNFLQCLKF